MKIKYASGIAYLGHLEQAGLRLPLCLIGLVRFANEIRDANMSAIDLPHIKVHTIYQRSTA